MIALSLVRREFVSRQLPARELVKRHVLVERAYHKVAVVIRVRPVIIVLEPAALGEAGDIATNAASICN